MSRFHRRGFGGCMLAACLVVVMVVAELIALGHAWTERHVICPEHGELIHAGELGQTVTDPPAGVRAVSPPKPARDTEHRGHDHCMGLACGQNLAALATGSALDGLMQNTAVEALVSPRDEGQRGVAILRQAPKTSPPNA